MSTKKTLLLTLLGALFLGGCAAPSRILIGQTFIGKDKTFKVMMTQPQGDDDDRVSDQYMRVCTLQAGKEINCKDTLVLKDVRPGSLY